MGEASALGSPTRWIIKTTKRSLWGSIQPWVPNAPPWPNVPGESISVTSTGFRTTPHPNPKPMPLTKPEVSSPVCTRVMVATLSGERMRRPSSSPRLSIIR